MSGSVRYCITFNCFTESFLESPTSDAVALPSVDALAPLSVLPVKAVVRQLVGDSAGLVRSPTSQSFIAGVARVAPALCLATPWNAPAMVLLGGVGGFAIEGYPAELLLSEAFSSCHSCC